MKAPRSVIPAVIFFLGAVALLYRVMPYLSSKADTLTSVITSKIQESLPQASFCTSDIGEGFCCDLHLKAEPCLDECRKAHVDRETFALTKEYDACATECLAVYQSTCGKEEAPSGSALEKNDIGDEKDSKVRRARRRSRRSSPI